MNGSVGQKDPSKAAHDRDQKKNHPKGRDARSKIEK
jgi:hypothetical protein